MHDDARRRLVYEVVARRQRGESLRGISRQLCIHRATVRAILRGEEERRADGEPAVARAVPPPATPRASMLDRYAAQIDAWLDEHPDLTAVRLQEKLAAQGFTGGYTIVRQCLRAAQARRGDKPQAVQIVETPPGQQCQFDWSPYELPGVGKIQLWSCTLSWSRARSFFVTCDTTQSTILQCLQQSFAAWEGVPQQAVTDTMSGVVDRWECNQPLLNVRFVDFAAYYRFALDVSPRRYPQYKGKVERTFLHVLKNLLNGRSFHSLEQFRETLQWWQREKAMARPHPRTGRSRWDMLAEERPHLQPLPARPYDTRDVVIRQVEATGHVRHETNLYRVPDEHLGTLVYVCVGPDRLEVFDRGLHRLAEHARQPDGAKQCVGDTDPRRRRYDVTLLTSRLAAWDPLAEDFAHRLRRSKRYPGPELSYILGLQLTWSTDDIVQALQHALDYDAYDARAVERILTARYKPRTLEQQVAATTRDRVRATMQEYPVQSRDLGSYAALRHGDAAPAAPSQETADESPTAGEQLPACDPRPAPPDQSPGCTAAPAGTDQPAGHPAAALAGTDQPDQPPGQPA
jgi:transposase